MLESELSVRCLPSALDAAVVPSTMRMKEVDKYCAMFDATCLVITS